jgi:DNA-binding GntR family transcriptional regulator
VSHTTEVKVESERIYEYIKRHIETGEYAPSQRLVEADLVRSCKANRHNIRLALERLRSVGLVIIEPNRGATVATQSLEEVLDNLIAREALEVMVTQLAARHISDQELAALRQVLDDMKLALIELDFDRYSLDNKRFHAIIYAASKNQTLPELIGLIRNRMARLQLRTILIPGRNDKSIAEHSAIYEALAARDETRAAEAIRQHLQSLQTAIRKAWALIKV